MDRRGARYLLLVTLLGTIKIHLDTHLATVTIILYIPYLLRLRIDLHDYFEKSRFSHKSIQEWWSIQWIDQDE